MTQPVDFQKAFGMAAGGLASLGNTLIQFTRDAEREMANPDADEEVKQAAKGAVVIATMIRNDIVHILTQLREPLLAGAPEELKGLLSASLDAVEDLKKQRVE